MIVRTIKRTKDMPTWARWKWHARNGFFLTNLRPRWRVDLGRWMYHPREGFIGHYIYRNQKNTEAQRRASLRRVTTKKVKP